MKKRITICIVLALTMLTALSGCSSAGPEQEKVLIVAQGVDATTLDPGMHSETPTGNVERQIFDTLIQQDDDMQFQPGIATRWEAIDGTTWVIEIRSDVKFHDGSQLTATDVKFSIDRILDPANNSPQVSNLSAVSEVIVDSPTQLTIKTAEPYPILPARLAGLRIVPKDYVERVGNATFSQQPIGSGPYKLVSWLKDESVTLEANQDYWGGAPAITKVVFKPIPEAASRVMALQAGQVDIAVNIPPDQVAAVDSSKNAAIAKVASSRTIYAQMMADDGPLADPRVRLAINHAVDVPTIISELLGGNGIAMAQALNEMNFGYNPNLEPYGYDPQRAVQLLTEAGYPNGFKLRFSTPSGRYMMDKEVAEAIKGQLEAVGIEVELKVMEWGVYVDQIMSRTLDTDMWLIGWGNSLFDADGSLYSWFHTGQRYYYYPVDEAKAQEMDQLLDRGRTTLDPTGREQAYHAALEQIHEEAPWLLLYQQLDIYGVNNRVQWSPRADEAIILHRAAWK
ncbi:MAG: ABC transporter substrate-binding protein [Bacillota bacterium]